MWTWIMRLISALLAAVGAGILALTVRALRDGFERVVAVGLPVLGACAALILIITAVVIAASPAARPSLRR